MPPLLPLQYSGPLPRPLQQMGLQIETRPVLRLQMRTDLILICFDCPFVCLNRRTPVSCVHTNTYLYIYPPHIPQRMLQFCLCQLHAILPMHQIVLLPYQSTPVVVCLLVCSVEIMNTLQHIQVLSTCKCVEKK